MAAAVDSVHTPPPPPLQRAPSPTPSTCSVSSRDSALSKPPPPPKPQHLACSFTGTANSIALHQYIQTQKTGGSFTTERHTGTLSRAHVGYGYGGTIDIFVDALDITDQTSYRNNSYDGNTNTDTHTQNGTARPAGRNRTYTAPSVSNIFAPFADQDAGDGTTTLIRNEPVKINGKGASRVGDLRNMFEPPTSPSSSSPPSLAKEGTPARSKGKISDSVRMLQVQLTGDNTTWNLAGFNQASLHQHHDSESDTIYSTATQDFVQQVSDLQVSTLKPNNMPLTLPSSSHATVVDASESLIKSGDRLATFRLSSSSNQHDRDDSSATIKPNQTHAQPSTAIKMSPRHHPSSVPKKSRLSSIFASSPSPCNGETTRNNDVQTPPYLVRQSISSIASGSSSSTEPDGGGERSREPSVLVANADQENIDVHMRANDGSAFDFDWASPNKVVRQPVSIHQQDMPAGFVAYQGFETPVKQANPIPVETLSQTDHQILQLPVAVTAGPPPCRPDSVILNLEAQTDALDQGSETETIVYDSLPQLPTDEETEQATPPTAIPPQTQNLATVPRMPRPGIGRQARALYDIQGEASFNELSLKAGQSFEILNEQLAGGWSLAVIWDEMGVPKRGLIPQGWYCYIQDFTMSPPPAQGIEPPPTPSPADDMQDVRQADNPVNKLMRSHSSNGIPSASASPLTGWKPTYRTSSIRTSMVPVVGINNANASGGSWRRWQQNSSKNPDAYKTLSHMVEANVEGSANRTPSPSRLGTSAPNPSDLCSTPRANRIDSPKYRAADTAHGHLGDLGGGSILDLNSIALSSALQHELPHSSTPQAPLRNESKEEKSTAALSDLGWRGSFFGRKTLNRFASFVTSGAEEYIFSKDKDLGDDDLSRTMARKVSGGSSVTLANSSVADASYAGGSLPNLAAAEANDTADPDQHFVIAGPAGPKWKTKTPPFFVQVHSPEKRTKLSGMHEYTVFCVTSTFPCSQTMSQFEISVVNDEEGDSHGTVPYDPTRPPETPGATLTVLRRFTQFAWLYQTLMKLYPALVIPPLPEKQYVGRFAFEFIETRRADLELWVGRIIRHPVLRYSEAVLFFLSCEGEVEWRHKAAKLLRGEGIDGSAMAGKKKLQGEIFARTWHPDFNFDAAEAAIEAEAMDAHLRANEATINGVGGNNVGRHGVMGAYKAQREGAVLTSSTYRDLSYTWLRLITGAGVVQNLQATFGGQDSGGGTYPHDIHGPPMGNLGKKSESGATNEQGAWCWREGCHDCVNLTWALQSTSESLQDVADLYEYHARETLLRQHERLKDVSRPHAHHQALLEVHRATLAKYREATGEPDPHVPEQEEQTSVQVEEKPKVSAKDAERIASRCETVLNVTLSEMDRVHDERVQDFHALGKSFLDSEIELYENVLETLRAARAHYSPEYYDREEGTHILSSRYQTDLQRPKRQVRPLPMPSAAPAYGGGLGAGVGMMISSATGGVIRPVSSYASLDSLSESNHSNGSNAGFIGTLFLRNRSSNSSVQSNSYPPLPPPT